MGGTYDSWKTTDPADAGEHYDPKREQELAEEALHERNQDLEEELRVAKDELSRLRGQVAGNKARADHEAHQLRRRVRRARELTHKALLAAESGGVSMPWAQLDAALTEALCELGCAGCGEKLGLTEMQLLVHVRRTGCHATGDCVEIAGKGEAKAIALRDVRAQLIGARELLGLKRVQP